MNMEFVILSLDYLLKIANILGIIINSFMYFDIETISDVLVLSV